MANFPELMLCKLSMDDQRVVAPKKVLEDDQVWVLHGATKPVILRPEGSDRYGFLGMSLVCDDEGVWPDDPVSKPG